MTRRPRKLPTDRAQLQVRMTHEQLACIDTLCAALDKLANGDEERHTEAHYTRSDTARIALDFAYAIMLPILTAMSERGAAEVVTEPFTVSADALLRRSEVRPPSTATTKRMVRLALSPKTIAQLRDLCDALKARTGAKEPNDYIADTINTILDTQLQRFIAAARNG